MKRAFSIAVLLGMFAVGAMAQDAEDETDAEPDAAEQPEAEAEPAEPPPPEEVFVPSERISADQEVIFPVDI